jgi:3-methyladenine DNA glycosylase/8-oxoguanine DNA glycosylase
MKNRLTDLNDHLFAQIERLGDEDLSQEALGKEAERAKAIVAVADQIVKNGALQLKAAELAAKHGQKATSHLTMIEHKPAVTGTPK